MIQRPKQKISGDYRLNSLWIYWSCQLHRDQNPYLRRVDVGEVPQAKSKNGSGLWLESATKSISRTGARFSSISLSTDNTTPLHSTSSLCATITGISPERGISWLLKDMSAPLAESWPTLSLLTGVAQEDTKTNWESPAWLDVNSRWHSWLQVSALEFCVAVLLLTASSTWLQRSETNVSFVILLRWRLTWIFISINCMISWSVMNLDYPW